VPSWLHQITTPWTTPFTLVALVIGIGALFGIRGRKLAVLATAIASGVALWVAWKSGPPSGLLDLKIYTNAARSWLDGRSLYVYHDEVFNLSATYPPIGPIAFSVLNSFSSEWREIIFTVINLFALGGCAWFASGLAGIEHDHRVNWSLWAFTAATVTLPVWLTLRQGQINILLWLLILIDIDGIRRSRRFAGFGIGLATAIKLVPGLFIVWLAATRRWSATLRAIGMLAGATTVGWLLAPTDSRLYWTDLLWQSDRVGRLDDARNNSVLGVLSRLMPEGSLRTLVWIVILAFVLLAAYRRSVRASKAGDLLAAAAIVGCASAVVSPISWPHHLGFLLLALAVFVTITRSTKGKVACVFGFLLLVDPGGHGDEVFSSTLRAVLIIGAVLFTPIVENRSLNADTAEAQETTTPSNRSTNSRLPSSSLFRRMA